VFSDTEFLKKALTWDRFSVVEEVKVRQRPLGGDSYAEK
jgi:hypothetical protein